ncbi:MAG TPA: hypothetical protein VHA55_04470 [Pseudorhodoplanes sp.]|jgi:hypothetical protein|nr:hypothetical protein [Pseudorhodoplanes sp.]
MSVAAHEPMQRVHRSDARLAVRERRKAIVRETLAAATAILAMTMIVAAIVALRIIVWWPAYGS